jgi:hypothetical protein
LTGLLAGSSPYWEISLEVHVSLTTKKDRSSDGSASQKALNAATQTAAQVVPMAKNAGQAARQSAEAALDWAEPQVRAAREWAEPQVRAARSWAAPRVEQAGVAVRDKIAPTVSAALVEASHRLDGAQQQQRRRRRWPRLVAIVAMLAAAASAAAAVFLKRQAEVVLSPEDQPADGGATAAAQGDATATPQGDGATRAAGEAAPGQPAPGQPAPGQNPPAAGQTGPDSDDLLP